MLALPARTPINYVSLFSGIGGFDIGFDRAGMRCKMQVEFNKHASGVLAHHWPTVDRLKDVRDVRKDTFRAVDLICGGFPCQDVSVAGRRAGLAGERSGLWFEFLRIITEHTPRWVVIENVPGLLSSNRGRDFAVIVDGLVKCGYCVAWRVLDAQYFGVPQRRRRVFIVASLGNGRCAEVLFEREGRYGDSPPSREAGQGFAGDAANGVGSYRQTAFGEYANDDRAGAIKARDFKDATDLVAYNVTFCDANGRRADRPNGGLYVNETEQSNTLTNGGIDGTLVAFSAANLKRNAGAEPSEHTAPKVGAEMGDRHPAIAFQFNAGSSVGMGMGHDVSPTLQVSDAHPPAGQRAGYGVRRLTPKECERLQGFPDHWTDVNGQSDSARYKQLGNAVCVNVSEWLGRRIAAADASA